MGKLNKDGRIYAILKKIKEPEIFFLVAATFFGGLFIFLIPPMQAYDEQAHFFRAYQFSTFTLRSPLIQEANSRVKSPGGYLPSNISGFGDTFLYSVRMDKGSSSRHKLAVLKHDYRKYAFKTVDYKDKNPIAFAGSSVYSPVSYLPQIIGIWIGRLLHLPILLFYYLSRILTLAAWIFLIYKATKMLPVGKWLMVTAALTPLSLSLAGSFSADAMTIALSFFTVALFLKYTFSKQPVETNDIILITIASTAVALCKSGLWPIALLFWLIPVARFVTFKKYAVSNFIISGASIGFFSLWYLVVHYAVRYIAVTGGAMVDPSRQLQYIKHAPWTFMNTMLHQFVSWRHDFDYFKTGFGMLGWGEAYIGFVGLGLVALTLLAATMFALSEKIPKPNIRPKQRLGSLAIFILLMGIMSLSLYITSTAVGAPIIDAVQGRYIIPFIPLAIPILAGLGYRYKKSLNGIHRHAWILAPAITLVLCIATVAVVSRYY